jgi:hypothetical protein
VLTYHLCKQKNNIQLPPNPLKHERERKRKGKECSVRLYFNRGKRKIFAAVKVSRQCPRYSGKARLKRKYGFRKWRNQSKEKRML